MSDNPVDGGAGPALAAHSKDASAAGPSPASSATGNDGTTSSGTAAGVSEKVSQLSQQASEAAGRAASWASASAGNAKVATVTGASRGIGAAVAERLARDGFAVVVNYAGQAAPAEALVRRIEAGDGRVLPVQADVSDPAAVRRMFDAAEGGLGGVDVLVNNAGIIILSTVAETDDAVFDRQIAVNLKGTFNTLREAATRLRSGGRIINFLSSVTGLLQPTYAAYAATKAAVE